MAAQPGYEKKDTRNSSPHGGFEDIVVAIDFTKGSTWAADRAARLPLERGARLSLVHVLPAGMPAKARALAEGPAQRSLEELAARTSDIITGAGRTDVRVIPALLTGQAYVETIRHARSTGADLIVVGRHGRRAVRDMFIGSTAERVIRKATTPVLVVGGKPAAPYQRPLLALELDASSPPVVDLALRAIQPDVTRLFAVHVYDVPFEGWLTPSFSKAELEAYRRDFEAQSRSRLDRFLSSSDKLGVRWSASLRHGDPRVIIPREVRKRRADLLVLGRHARGGIAHALLGNVTEWLIRSEPCDVLVARPSRIAFELP
jgi:nucleotide-binding universal stress UspA family protein